MLWVGDWKASLYHKMGGNPMTHLALAMGTSERVVQCWGESDLGCHTLCINT